LGGRGLGLVGVEDLLGLLDQGQYVAHAKDSGWPSRSGWKTSKSSSFSPLDANRIGTPVTSRTDSAAPPRASTVELGQHHTGESDALAEGVGRGHRVLADHGVEDEDHFVWVDGRADRGGLAHQFLIDAEAAGRGRPMTTS